MTQAMTNTFPKLLQSYLPEIARALPRHISAERMSRIALTAFRLNPKLAECDPRSVFAAVIQAAQLGLEVGILNEAYLVPFSHECQLIPGYQGLIKLARNSGLIADIYAHEVRANDHFELTFGLQRNLVHQPLMANGFLADDDTRGPVVGFYAVAVLKDGTKPFYAMALKAVEEVRDKSKGYQAAKRYHKQSIWDTDFVAMSLKTVIRRLCKYLPRSVELATALSMDAVAEQGKPQELHLNEVISGEYSPPLLESEEVEAMESAEPRVVATAEPEPPLDPQAANLLAKIELATAAELQPLLAELGNFKGIARRVLTSAWKSRQQTLTTQESS